MEPEQAFRILERKFRKTMTRMPIIVGNEAVNFTLDNFMRQGFLGNTFQRWLSRKQGWKKDNRSRRNVLINTGRLRRSIRIVRTTTNMVVIGSDVPYARAHNEGSRLGVIQEVRSFTRKNGSEVKAHTRKVNQNLPRRQFIGNSPYLNTRIKRVAAAAIMKDFKL